MDRETAGIARKFAASVRRRYDVKKIILFGSRARGDNFINSDYDFIIVSDDFEGIRFTDRMGEIYKYWKWKYLLEPLCYTTGEFEKKRKMIGIVRHALRKGIAF